MGYVSLLEILRPKKNGYPISSSAGISTIQSFQKNDAPFKQNSATWGSVHPWKIKSQRNFWKYSQKMLAKKKQKKTGENFTTYVLENVVKKLLVFPPPSSKWIFLIPKAAAGRIFEKKKKLHKSLPIPMLEAWEIHCWEILGDPFAACFCQSFLGVSIKTIGGLFSGFGSLQPPSDIIPQFH